MKLRIGSRRSDLARAQAATVADALVEAHPDLEIEWVWIKTSGDRFRAGPLRQIGGKGLFIKEIEEALLDGQIDVAIHSGKDIPPELPEGLCIEVTPPRASEWDVLCSLEGGLDEGRPLKIGTSSLRRGAQLQRRYPHLQVEPVRGNVGTRLGKVTDGYFDGVVLAEAGLERLGLAWEGHTERLEWMLPATAQGTLGLEWHRDDTETGELLAVVHDRDTWHLFQAERGAQQAVGGDCFLPFGAHARFLDGERERLEIRAAMWSEDGAGEASASTSGSVSEALALGREVGQKVARDADGRSLR